MIFTPIPNFNPVFESVTISELTASQVVMTDANKKLISADYLNQAVKTTSSPTFTGLTIGSISGMIKGTAGVLGAATAGVDYQTGTLTAGRIPFATGAPGTLTDSSNLTFNGTNLTCLGNIYAANLNPTAWNAKADYAFGANSFTGSGDFSGGNILGTSIEAENLFYAGTNKISFFGATPAAKTTVNDPAATGNQDNEIGGLTISSSYDQTEITALRDKCEELADDVRALHNKLSELINALQGYGLV